MLQFSPWIALSALLTLSNALTIIDPASCGPAGAPNATLVNNALLEMTSIADMAVDRLLHPNDQINSSVLGFLKSLFGNTPVDRVVNVYKRVSEIVHSVEAGVTIYCNENHIKEDPAAGGRSARWVDSTNNLVVPAPIKYASFQRPIPICMLANHGRAYTYEVLIASRIIVLCPSTIAPTGTPPLLGDIISEDISGILLKNQPIDVIDYALSCTLLHEFTHTVLMQNLLTVDVEFNANGTHVDAYGYTNSSMLVSTHEDLTVKNADSFKILGAGLFLKNYEWVDGKGVIQPIIIQNL
ncbi:MAG: hypothetical protein M1833_003129 [Piccolia ochrophora]|nr:MAG: hypothetical protein M1833_003129 [Piccolia ochrophora]